MDNAYHTFTNLEVRSGKVCSYISIRRIDLKAERSLCFFVFGLIDYSSISSIYLLKRLY